MKKRFFGYKIGENKLTMAQNSKGIWYCTEATVYCTDIFDGVEIMDSVMTAVNESLKDVNSVGVEVKEVDTKNKSK